MKTPKKPKAKPVPKTKVKAKAEPKPTTKRKKKEPAPVDLPPLDRILRLERHSQASTKRLDELEATQPPLCTTCGHPHQKVAYCTRIMPSGQICGCRGTDFA